MYDPYGRLRVLNGEADADGGVSDFSADADNTSDWDNEILFCGYRRDAETGLYHVRFRYYHASLGRWLSRDPAGYKDGISLYQYVRSNPVTALDPMGLKTWTEATAKAELKEQITSWRGSGYNFAADLMQHFVDKKGPQAYTPTQANIDEVKKHGRDRILDEVFG